MTPELLLWRSYWHASQRRPYEMKLKLIEEWRSWWRMWSMRLAVLASAAVTGVLAYPDILLSTLNALPPEMRAVFPPFMGFVLLGLVSLARLVKQEKKDG